MCILALVFSFFIHINASDVVISVEEFLDNIGKRLTVREYFEKDFECRRRVSTPSENLITIHLQIFGESEITPATMRSQLLNAGSLVRTLKIDDPHGILMHGDTFAPELRPKAETRSGIEMCRADGTRTVGIYEYNGSKVCFKKWPEAPWNEIAAYQIYKALFPDVAREDMPLPISEVIWMNGHLFSVRVHGGGTF